MVTNTVQTCIGLGSSSRLIIVIPKNIFILLMSNVAPATLGLVQIRASLWGVRPPPPTNRADHKSLEWYSITNGSPSSRKRAILGDGRHGISRFHLLNRDATDHFLEYVLG